MGFLVSPRKAVAGRFSLNNHTIVSPGSTNRFYQLIVCAMLTTMLLISPRADASSTDRSHFDNWFDVLAVTYSGEERCVSHDRGL